MITTTQGLMDEATLIKHEGLIDNDIERTTSVEYCLPGCEGQAHLSGNRDAVEYFCQHHIHRSVHVTLKKPVELFAEASSFA